jgi:F-type H+-transporting ATPase subunit b
VLIDWFTVIAQIVNFLILIFLLKYFLYDRIIRAMEEREGKIRSRLEEADQKRQEAESEGEAYRRKQQELESKREDMLSQAKKEADEEREKRTHQARQEAENLRSKWLQALEREKSSFLAEIRRLSGQEVYDVSRKALKDLADASLQEQVIERFLRQFQEMGKDEQREMSEAAQQAENSVQVRSAFEISTQLRRKITAALHEALGDDAEVEYDTDPEMILGIELKMHSQKVAWSLGDYLDELEHETRELLDRETQAGDRREKEGESKKRDDEQESS